jgi:hypothetical protein
MLNVGSGGDRYTNHKQNRGDKYNKCNVNNNDVGLMCAVYV